MYQAESPCSSWHSSEEQSARNVDPFTSGEYLSLPPNIETVDVHNKSPLGKACSEEVTTKGETSQLKAEEILIAPTSQQELPVEMINTSTKELTNEESDSHEFKYKTINDHCKDNIAEGSKEINSEDIEPTLKVSRSNESYKNKTERLQSNNDTTEKYDMNRNFQNGNSISKENVDDNEHNRKYSCINHDNHENNFPFIPSFELGEKVNVICAEPKVSESVHGKTIEIHILDGKDEYQQSEPTYKFDFHQVNHAPCRRLVSLPVRDPPSYTGSLDYFPAVYSLPSEFTLRRSVSLFALGSSPFNGIVVERLTEQDQKQTRFMDVPAISTVTRAPPYSMSYESTTSTVLATDGFEELPCSAFCKSCQTNIITTTSIRYDSGTYCCCCLMFFSGICCPLSFLPFIINGPKKVYHNCPQCNEVIGVHDGNDK